jgi:glycosyltransferase involved in cell wall biosynthesis
MKILLISSEWPSPEFPFSGVFVAQQVEFLRKAGIQVNVFHFRGKKHASNYVKAWFRLHQEIHITSYDLIHAHFGQGGLLCWPRPHGIPLVVTFHGSDVLGIIGESGQYTLVGRILQVVSWLVARSANEAIVVSRELMDHLPKRSYHLIPLGVDFSLFKPTAQTIARHKLGIDSPGPFVIFGADPGETIKRFNLAQVAVELVRDEFPDIQLIPLLNIPHLVVPSYMNACNVLLLTSIHEGSPTVVKEVLANRQRVDSRSANKDLDETIVAKKVIFVYKKALENI